MRISSAAVSLIGGSLLLAQPSHALEIRMISDRVPEDSYARRVKTDGSGDCFVYEGDVQYQFNGTDNPAFGENIKHIWKTCGVFGESNQRQHTLLSTLSTIIGEDDDFPSISNDGTKVCYHTKDLSVSAIATVDTDTMAISYYGKVTTDDWEARKSTYCDMSPDGSTIVFQSTSSLVKNVTNPSNKYQLYATYDHGATFKLIAGKDIAQEGAINFLSAYPQVTNKGRRITFQSKIPYEDESDTPFGLKINELYLYDKKADAVERLTNFNSNFCNLTEVFEHMKDYWGEGNLTSEGVTKASFTQCNLAATLGWGGRTSGNLLGAGHGPARISEDGRFITYTAGFAHANVRGKYESPQIITADNLFLHDTVLGLIWQLSKEGDVGSDFQAKLRDECCPYATPSYAIGTCSTKREYTGFCCWQRSCWFPAQWPDISSDGDSITFYASHPQDGDSEIPGDYEILHYHIPTSTFTVVTNTTHKDLDDTYSSISSDGQTVAFESKYDHITNDDTPQDIHAFAARLTYGCPAYVEALNYMADPDVAVACKWADSPSSALFVGSGISVRVSSPGLQTMLSNIPFTSEGKAKRGICKTYSSDIRRDFAHLLGIPEDHILPHTRDLSRCSRFKQDDHLTFTYAFLRSGDEMFGEIYGTHGEPSDWVKDTLRPQFSDPMSGWYDKYLLKTAISIKSKENLQRSDFVKE